MKPGGVSVRAQFRAMRSSSLWFGSVFDILGDGMPLADRIWFAFSNEQRQRDEIDRLWRDHWGYWLRKGKADAPIVRRWTKDECAALAADFGRRGGYSNMQAAQIIRAYADGLVDPGESYDKKQRIRCIDSLKT